MSYNFKQELERIGKAFLVPKWTTPTLLKEYLGKEYR